MNRRVRDPYARWCERCTSSVTGGGIYSIVPRMVNIILKSKYYNPKGESPVHIGVVSESEASGKLSWGDPYSEVSQTACLVLTYRNWIRGYDDWGKVAHHTNAHKKRSL